LGKFSTEMGRPGLNYITLLVGFGYATRPNAAHTHLFKPG
jgi:hypothetical protein